MSYHGRFGQFSILTGGGGGFTTGDSSLKLIIPEDFSPPPPDPEVFTLPKLTGTKFPDPGSLKLVIPTGTKPTTVNLLDLTLPKLTGTKMFTPTGVTGERDTHIVGEDRKEGGGMINGGGGNGAACAEGLGPLTPTEFGTACINQKGQAGGGPSCTMTDGSQIGLDENGCIYMISPPRERNGNGNGKKAGGMGTVAIVGLAAAALLLLR